MDITNVLRVLGDVKLNSDCRRVWLTRSAAAELCAEWLINDIPILIRENKNSNLRIILNEFTCEMVPKIISLLDLQPFKFNILIDGDIRMLTNTIYCDECLIDCYIKYDSYPYDYCIVALRGSVCIENNCIRLLIAVDMLSLEIAIGAKMPFTVSVDLEGVYDVIEFVELLETGNEYVIGLCSNISGITGTLVNMLPKLEYIGDSLDEFISNNYIEHNFYKPLIKSARR